MQGAASAAASHAAIKSSESFVRPLSARSDVIDTLLEPYYRPAYRTRSLGRPEIDLYASLLWPHANYHEGMSVSSVKQPAMKEHMTLRSP